MPNSNIALLVFSLSTEAEVKNKPFFEQRNLATSLSNKTKKIAKHSGLPIIYFDETKQSGSSFGERFSNALQNVFESGYDKIITIGNDCPQLDVRHIRKAEEALANGNSAIGPTFDGGFYLLGISKDDFDYNSFLHFSWNSNAVYNEVFNSIATNHDDCLVLQKLRDIDFLYDLEKLSLKDIYDVELYRSIQAIQTAGSGNYSDNDLTTFKLLQAITFNKGSPFSFSFQF
ncbi:DUF2064 domain-containing protein [Aquimarina gracilis]|uniref:DUF2064 domain-containing protein n=1 Tax=Aquimarina gracilis TaxID=874422 RepID=A0ABU5ZP26_9FLAO|nr:DUF2064 domain-containing protein [Aquimarina gracilis]MEB3343900.1 DUF2064 domain-containing protein [Aquimarina gracilis]